MNPCESIVKSWMFLTSAALFAIVMSVDSHAQSRDQQGLLGRIDHLVYATPDLTAGVRQIEALLGETRKLLEKMK